MKATFQENSKFQGEITAKSKTVMQNFLDIAVGMQNFLDIAETRKRSFISAFSICVAVLLITTKESIQ